MMCTAGADDSTAYLAISGGQSRTVVAEEATILLVDIIRVHGSLGHSLECREVSQAAVPVQHSRVDQLWGLNAY